MKRGQIPYRIYFLGAIMLLSISALSFRLWYVQIARGAEYTAKVASGSRITVRIPAVRGDILTAKVMAAFPCTPFVAPCATCRRT